MPRITPTTALHGPYYSTKRDPTVALNGRATVGGSLLSCENLSVLWERSFNAAEGGAGKPDYRHFSSVEGLQAHAPHDIDTLATRRKRAEIRFVDNNAWGSRIADAFKSMEASGRKHQSLLVRSPVHLMSFGLLDKSREGHPCYVAKFYDPNVTATHLRAQAASPDAFARLTASDFFPGESSVMAEYGMAPDSGSVVFLGDPMPDHSRQPVEIRHLDAPTLLHLLESGVAKGVARFGELLKDSRPDPRNVAAMLGAKLAQGTPGLFVAMNRGDCDTIKAYGDILVESDLAPAQNAELLACRNEDGVPGLHCALQDDRPEVIRAWGDALVRCKLDDQDIAALLAARRPNGPSGLGMAMWLNNDRAILAHGKILLASGLPAPRLVDLLESTDPEGNPAMFLAMYRGHARAIRAFGSVLVNSPTDAEQRARLLAATNRNGWPALAAALQENRASAIRAYGTVLARSLPDPLQRSRQLGINGDQTLAISAALQLARPATRQVYVDVVKALTH